VSTEPTAIVPYAQMEKMAVTVAKSGLFGMKTPEQALALMALAQSEGIHPMTAVRDYHIIQGRPSLKADTMLARFQAAGGVVKWLCLTDLKCEGEFSHPVHSPVPVKIDWTIERAKKAGLAGKEVWIGYARAMLRSRTISEGVRTVLPGVIQGVYTPEESQYIDPEVPAPVSVEQAVQSFDKPGMAGDSVDVHMRNIVTAQDMPTLKEYFAVAYKLAKDASDEPRMNSFKLAYDARKSELADRVRNDPKDQDNIDPQREAIDVEKEGTAP
jgi:hypothetical protein